MALLILSGYGKVGGDHFIRFLGVPAYWENVLIRPWTLLVYMFTHFDFLHLFFNLLWLYWFGTFFLDFFSERELSGVYIMGGIAGALLYILSYNFIPTFELSRYYAVAVGASASIMAIVFAVCFYIPNHRIYIFLLGSFKLIHLALFTALIDVVSALSSNNAGGHIAHLGGALFGLLFVFAYKKNKNLVRPWIWGDGQIQRFLNIKERGSYKKQKQKNIHEMTDMEYNAYKRRKDERINKILDKISRSGYDSLTREEKELLFKSGRE